MIETERLLIRPWKEDDASHYMKMASDAGYTAFSTPGYYLVNDANEARQKLISRIRLFEDRGLGKFPVFLKESGEFIGTCGLDPFDLNGTPAVELGYSLCLDFWGKGFATESALALLKYGFSSLGLNAVHAFAVPQNTASIKVIEKLSMKSQGDFVYSGLLHKLYCRHDDSSAR
jgi:ribosomal-protein-alanine N-acetyltransferase